jgi:osmoprotectant transport system ATP-binding protein
VNAPPPARGVLAADRLSKRYGAIAALDAVSIDVAEGQCLAVVGESGSGKTTLLRCFNRLLEPSGGLVFLHGADLAALDPVAVRRTIGYVPQDGGLLPHWRVLRNVALVPWLRGAAEPLALARAALELVGLGADNFAARWPRELSGGERQRVAIARALAGQPRIVLLDEPFGALDALTRADLQELFADLQRHLGLTAVLVTHDLREALLLGNRVAVMRRGRIEQVAAPGEIVASPATDYVRQLFQRARVGAP